MAQTESNFGSFVSFSGITIKKFYLQAQKYGSNQSNFGLLVSAFR